MTEDYIRNIRNIRNIRGIRDIRGRRIGDPPFHKGDSEVSPPRKKTGISLKEIPAESTG